MNSTHIFGAIELGGPPPEDIQKQLDRIIHSKVFRHASALQRLLRYLVAKAIADPYGEIKEYTIGVEVFDRGADYDPQIDTFVRVQIHRLRLKVKEFYQSEGTSDPIILEIPKGHYIPAFAKRSDAALRANETEGPTESAAAATPAPADSTEATLTERADRDAKKAKASQFTRGRIAMVSMVFLVFACGILLGARWKQAGAAAEGSAFSGTAGLSFTRSNDAVQSFWRSYLGNDAAPVVGYADAVFLVDGDADLFRFRRGAIGDRGTQVEPHLAQQYASNPALVGKAGPLYYEDGYTGTGDVESIFALTRLFTQMGLQMTVERCRLVTIDDLKLHNVILLGSPDQNDAVAQLPQIADFVFNRPNVPGPWRGEFVDRHPQPGESPAYKTERDADTLEVKSNYGLITVQPGAVPGRYIAILGGLDTSGVAGTAQFMTSPSQMAELRKRLESLGARMDGGPPPAFQALLRVDVEKGHDVVGVHLVTVHLLQSEKNGVEPTAEAGAR